MTQYSIKIDDESQSRFLDFKANTFEEAIVFAKSRIPHPEKESKVTLSIRDENDYLLASITNRKIIGEFVKENWTDHDGVYTVGTEEFDATSAVLHMDHSHLIEVYDKEETSVYIGRQHINWNGPCSVHITDNICRYFGVEDIEEITPEAIEFARKRANLQPLTKQVITLSIKVYAHVAPDASIDEFVDNLDYSILSETPGISVFDTEIIDASEPIITG